MTALNRYKSHHFINDDGCGQPFFYDIEFHISLVSRSLSEIVPYLCGVEVNNCDILSTLR